jgi:peptide/nickel transport system substrate-binding protein
MHRRTLLLAPAGLAALPLAAPALAQNARAGTLRFVPQANLSVLDPVWTTATVTGNHGWYIFETLYAQDAQGRPQPQIAEAHEVSDDRLTWRFRLQEGQRFHDGTPVRAGDCAASLRRWAVRDPYGQLLAKVVAEWRTPDDRTLEIRLHKPFPLLLDAVSKTDASTPFIMPERLANGDPNRPLTEMVGSGPYRFVAAEFNSGSRAVYQRNPDYRPHPGPASNTAGAKIAHFERIEWQIIPDPATAAAALINGEVDWWERPQPDLQPLLARSRDLKREVADPAGRMAVMRLNHLQPPFNDVKLRQAVRLAVVQEDYMRAAQGDDTSMWTLCRSLWPKHTPYFHEEPDLMPASADRAKAMLREAGYAGQPLSIINPTDFPDIGPLGQVTADLLKKLGMKVDLLESDWGTVVQRRNSREPLDKGGWSIFHTTGTAGVWGNPASSTIVRGQGADGWFGWWNSPRAEELVQAWLDAPDEAAQRRTAQTLGRLALEEVATIPLGQFTIRTAYRRDLSGMLASSIPLPWNLKRG